MRKWEKDRKSLSFWFWFEGGNRRGEEGLFGVVDFLVCTEVVVMYLVPKSGVAVPRHCISYRTEVDLRKSVTNL